MSIATEDLSEQEKALARVRARGDYVISCAIDWIGRFHTQFPWSVIERQLEGIRSLALSMQDRSQERIQQRIDELLESQSMLLSWGKPTTGEDAKPVDRALPTVVPRLHDEWTYRADRFAGGPGENQKIRKGMPVFISYARADSTFLSRILVHLRPLERSGRIDLWHDGKLTPGVPWRQELDKALTRASVAVLLLSANFMASDFIYESEVPTLVRRAKSEGVSIFPVVFGHGLFDENPDLGSLQLFNDPERPLCHLPPSEADAVLVKLARAIRERA